MTDTSFTQKLGNMLRVDSWSDTNPWNTIVDWFLQPRDSTIQPLKLHIYGNESMSLQSEITDNYVESNIAYQDHIALKPQVFTVVGEVGELTWFKNDAENSLSGAVAQKLQPVAAFLPPVSKRASAIQDKAIRVLDIVDSVDNFANRIFNMFSSEDTEQQKSYKYLMALWKERTPINIKTPWMKVENYVIQNIEFTQPDRTVDKTQVKISFKEFREVAETKTVEFNKSIYQLRAAVQKATQVKSGTTTGVVATAKDIKPNQWSTESLLNKVMGG